MLSKLSLEETARSASFFSILAMKIVNAEEKVRGEGEGMTYIAMATDFVCMREDLNGCWRKRMRSRKVVERSRHAPRAGDF